ncbi:MAG: hypothetical protein AB7S36_19655 [Planctomycetota bacterium]
MRNADIADIFFELADLLWLQGGERYRSRAFWRIGRVLEQLAEPVAAMIRKGTLEKLPDIGDGAVHRIKQILRTGTCDDHRRLSAAIPAGVREVGLVRGIGPRRLKQLWQRMRIGSVDELEAAARSGKLESLPVFGAGDVQRLIGAIREYREHRGRERIPMPRALVEAERLVEVVRALPGVVRAEVAGSLRRRKETTKDVDVLVAAEGPGVVRAFMEMRDVGEVILGDTGRASVRLSSGLQADIRVLLPEQFGAGMHYFTGSKDHNIAMRIRAKHLGRHLCEHGVYLDDKVTLVNACADEADVFRLLGLRYIPPELREGMGEIKAAERGTLPALIEAEHLLGDHRTVAHSIDDAAAIADAALQRGLRHVVVAVPRDLRNELERLRDSMLPRGQRVVVGSVTTIGPDGELDRELAELAEWEHVHAEPSPVGDELPFELLTSRVVRAIESGVVDCIARPSGRQFGQRPAANLDLERVFRAARRAAVAVEVSGEPDRLDLDALAVRHAVEMGTPLALCSGATTRAGLTDLRFALFTARRGWATVADVLNTQPVEHLLQRRHRRISATGIAPTWQPPVADAPTIPRNEPDDGAVAELAERLRHPPLDAAMRERLHQYLAAGEDADLHAALSQLGGNPVQAAFNLLVGG